MIARVVLALLIPASLAFFVISLLWRSPKTALGIFCIKIFLAAGLGCGIFSCTFLIWLSVFGASTKAFWLTQAIICIVLALVWWRTRSQAPPPPPAEVAASPNPQLRFGWALDLVFFIALISAISAFIFLTLKSPHGNWDAWAVHNMKARLIFRAGDAWQTTFSSLPAWASLDYPLLVSFTIAGGWTLVGNDTLIIPGVVAFLFTFGTVGLLVSSLSISRSKAQGLLAGLVLLGSPLFIAQGSNQYLDIPIGYFFLASLSLFSLLDHLPDNQWGLLVLAGMSTGFSAWTKNEGFLFILAVVVARFFMITAKQGLKTYLKQMRPFAIGLGPVVLVIIYFKARFGAANLFLSGDGASILEKLLDGGRYVTVLSELKTQLTGMGGWTIAPIIVLLLYLLLLGPGKEWKNPNAIAALMTLFLMLLGYFFIFIITPFDLKWHLATTLDRLLMQLWPSFIFVFFLSVRTPEYMKHYRDHLVEQTTGTTYIDF